MSVSFRFEGLKELLAEFATLARDMTEAAAPDVEAAGHSAAAEISAGYPDRTGNLRDGLDVIIVRDGDDAVKAIVVNTSKHAAIFENGTQARHTDIGANRGSMPANPVFTATMIRTRAALLNGPIPDVMRAFGLEVVSRG